MKHLNKIISIVSVIALIISLSACSEKKEDVTSSVPSPKDSKADTRVRPTDGKKIGYQLEKPAEGEEIAVLNTNQGTIKLRLFSEAAPKTVENFKGLIRKGYYNGITFHRVINNFMIQGGDPKGDGTGGESFWNKDFEDEFNLNLLNIRGSVSMANRGPNTNGSQFFINQNKTTDINWDNFQKAYEFYKQNPEAFIEQNGPGFIDMSKVTDEYKKIYKECGGNPNLDGAYNIANTGHTVFAQVIEGMDVVDKIAAIAVNSQGKPDTDVVITKAEIEIFKE